METARGRAPHLVQSDRSQIAGAIARLLEELAPSRVVKTLIGLYGASGQKPRARERSGGLLDDQDPSRVIEARDDRADPRRVGHAGYGFLVGVGVGNGGSVALGRGIVGVGPGVRVGTGVRVGVGDGDGVGHGSGPTRFHV